MENIIISKDNEKIKYIKSLLKKKKRDAEQKFLIEGIRFLEEALDSKDFIELVAYSTKLLENARGQHLLEEIYLNQIPTIQVSEAILKDITDTESPQGILAIMRIQETCGFNLLKDNPLLLVIDGIQDPGNLGTIVRTADAAGIDGLILLKGTVDIYNPKTLRSTMGSIFRLPIWHIEEPEQLLKLCQQKGITLYVAMVNSDKNIYQANFTLPTAIVMGSEATGPREAIVNFADRNVTIPMPGKAESLNVAVATGVIIYEAVRQRLNI